MLRTLRPFAASRFPNFFDEAFLFRSQNGGEAKDWFTPQINVVESEAGYDVSLDLPGMKADEFNIEFKDGQLWVTGERKAQEEESGKTYHRVERYHGQFRRVVSLPVDVSADKIEATYKDGVLSISVPKAPTALPQKIVVKA